MEKGRAALISNCKVDFSAAVALPLLPTCFRPRCGTFRSVSMVAKGGERVEWQEEGAGGEGNRSRGRRGTSSLLRGLMVC